MGKIIIGIHGLGNKPPKELLTAWWRKSIREGLISIQHPYYFFRFEMVYWADLIYTNPLDPSETNSESNLYIHEPYSIACPESIPQQSGGLRRKVMGYLERQLDRLFLNEDMSLNFSSITDSIIHRYFKDLEMYYSDELKGQNKSSKTVRVAIQDRLITVIRRYRRKRITLIAHSMGSIIAYDVLSRNIPGVSVDTFITLGSPLGLPVIVSRIFAEQHLDNPLITKVCAPEGVHRKWYNFSDLEDKVCLDRTLSDDYQANSFGVKAEDSSVYNNYVVNGKRNPHKIYGYLRTADVAWIIDDFLYRGRWQPIQRLIKWINNWLYKHLG
jgi:hypothetical protein